MVAREDSFTSFQIAPTASRNVPFITPSKLPKSWKEHSRCASAADLRSAFRSEAAILRRSIQARDLCCPKYCYVNILAEALLGDDIPRREISIALILAFGIVLFVPRRGRCTRPRTLDQISARINAFPSALHVRRRAPVNTLKPMNRLSVGIIHCAHPKPNGCQYHRIRMTSSGR